MPMDKTFPSYNEKTGDRSRSPVFYRQKEAARNRCIVPEAFFDLAGVVLAHDLSDQPVPYKQVAAYSTKQNEQFREKHIL